MKRLRELREARNLTQAQVARDLGITRQSINHYESGYRQPDYDMVLKIARYFDVSIDYILGGDDTPTKPPVDFTEYQKKRQQLNDLFAKMTPEERDLLLAVAAKMKK